MKNEKLLALLNALGVAIYTILVALVMRNGERVFGKMDNLFGPVAFLLLFVLSAAVVGALILGKPVMMYFDGQKKEAVKMFVQTVLWLVVITVLTLSVQIII